MKLPKSLEFMENLKSAKTAVQSQRQFFNLGTTKNISFRIQQLKALKKAIKAYEERFYTAIYTDFKKSKFDTYTTELSLLYHEIDTCIAHLPQWSAKKHVASELYNLPASTYIKPEPKGVCLVIGAWNYPILLTLQPVVSAIAAGNTVIIKPSEVSVHISSEIAQVIHSTFQKEYIQVIEGGVDETQDLLAQKFDHIFFTGSTHVGKIVYQAAAKQLTPVTLELGGKCPAIIFDDAKVKVAAKRLVWGKFINAGQTCVAPDYLLVDAKIKSAFIAELIKQIEAIYGQNPQESEAYPRIINQKNFQRLAALLQKEKICYGGEINEQERYIAPTLMDQILVSDPIMQEEIFGPILPIITFNKIEEAVEIIQSHPNPLALYTFTQKSKKAQQIFDSIPSGGAMNNDCLIHLASNQIPFGGIGNSGIGQYHGRFGFDTFSHSKGVIDRMALVEPNFKYPPYTSFKFKLIKWLLK